MCIRDRSEIVKRNRCTGLGFGVGSHLFEGEAYLPTCEDALLASSAWTRWREGTATWLRRQGSFCSETAAQDRKMVFLKVVLVGLASPRGLTVQCFPQEYFSPTPPFHFRCVGPCGARALRQ